MRGGDGPDGCRPPPAARLISDGLQVKDQGCGQYESRLKGAGMSMWSSIRERGRAAATLLGAELMQPGEVW
jgi:hypothetical protein